MSDCCLEFVSTPNSGKRKIFGKTFTSHPLIRTRTCVYEGVRDVGFSEKFTYLLNE